MSATVAALSSSKLGTVTAAMRAVATTAGAWKVRSGLPGIDEGVVSTTLALDGAVAFAGTVNVVVTVSDTSASQLSVAAARSTSMSSVSAAPDVLGGVSSTSQMRWVERAGTQAVVVQWTPLAPPVAEPTEPPTPVPPFLPPAPAVSPLLDAKPAQAGMASATTNSRPACRFAL